MSLNDAQLAAAIPSDEQLAQIPGLTRAALESQIQEVLAHPQRLQQRSFNVGPAEASGECTKIPFGFSFFDVLAIKGHIEVCTGACWKARIEVCLEIFGNQIVCRSATLDCNGGETTLIDAGISGLAWLKVAVGARGSNVCFYLKGYAQFLTQREDFDETLFCIAALPTLDV